MENSEMQSSSKRLDFLAPYSAAKQVYSWKKINYMMLSSIKAT